MNNNENLISIIMPAYNVDQYIEESIKSVIKQTYYCWELIIVDDGSQDKTYNVADMYRKKDGRIKIIKQKNNGSATARNKGIEVAKGEYITFLDSDDYWDSKYLMSMINAIEKCNEYTMVYSLPTSVYSNGKTESTPVSEVPSKTDLTAYVTKYGDFRPVWNMDCFIVRKKILIDYGISFDHNIQVSQDIGFFLKLLSVVNTKCLPLHLSYYRRRTGSSTTQKWNPNRWRGTVDLYKYVEPYIKRNASNKLNLFYKMWGYKALSFIKELLRRNYIQYALDMIANERVALKYYMHVGKINDRLLCWLLLQEEPTVLKILHQIKR